jgi:flavin reductase
MTEVAAHPRRVLPSAQDFRATMGCFPTGVAVLTAPAGERFHGMTVNSVTSVSLQPLLILVCVRRQSTMDSVLAPGSPFGISVLARHQQGMAAHFADPARRRGWADLAFMPCRPGHAGGVPLIRGAVAWLECSVTARHPEGDHTVVVGRVTEAFHEPAPDPIVFFRGRYRHLNDQLLSKPSSRR